MVGPSNSVAEVSLAIYPPNRRRRLGELYGYETSWKYNSEGTLVLVRHIRLGFLISVPRSGDPREVRPGVESLLGQILNK